MLSLLICVCSLVASTTALSPPSGSSYGVPRNASYDYVVVGGGTAGLTIATRLAQDGRYSIAVVEAGGYYEQENGNHSVVPRYVMYGLAPPANPLVQWGFSTQPQAGANNRTLSYVRGKTLGGTSAFNFMVYQRPTVGTMEKWARDVDDESWQWSNVLRFYMRSASFTPPGRGARPSYATPEYDVSVFGSDGPLQVSFPPFALSVQSWLLKAAEALGVKPLVSGLQSGQLLGASWVPLTLDSRTRERSTSETAYLQIGRETERLTLYTHALAKNILFDGSTAVGVNIVVGDLSFALTARREVIVSCGALQSPQLLMVSGVGPKKHLQNFGISVVADRPGVGQNLWDHPIIGVTYAVDAETSSMYTNSPSKWAAAVAQYKEDRTGFLTSPGAEVMMFESLRSMKSSSLSASAREDLSLFPEDWPDTQICSFAQWFGPFLGSQAPSKTANYISLAPGLIAPLSRGQVTINSSDMADPPIIDPNWLTHPTDRELAIAAIRRAREYAATPAFQSIVIGQEAFPGADVTSDEDILRILQHQVSMFYHAAATCKMGMVNDSMAVVDSKARVIGVNNLRVVDISAMPFLPPGQPQSTVYMLAEKIAEDILTEGDNRLGNATVGYASLWAQWVAG